jgi:AAA domain, putative AbiEii toxin, Type IV TA system
MYITLAQIERSLAPLKGLHNFFGMSYLAFKRAEIPVGTTEAVVFSHIADEILDSYYKPSASYDGYYNPFITSRKEQRWTAPRYGSTTLQRITKDTFSDALLHHSKKSDWGWKKDYIAKLRRHLGDNLIPAFHLAVWLFRWEDWPKNATAETVRSKLFREFKVTDEEVAKLFDVSDPQIMDEWAGSTSPLTEAELLGLLGSPPGAQPEEGAAISYLGLREIGPATEFDYKPSERLNIITGDNSLGKTFILECVWWALTGGWLGPAVLPRKSAPKNKPMISFRIRTMGGKDRQYEAKYNWDRQVWAPPKNRASLPGLVIYARFDGSFAVWDPARQYQMEGSELASAKDFIFLSNTQIWDGLPKEGGNGRTQWVCNGLLRDWVSWQTSRRFTDRFSSLVACLKTLSPDPIEPLRPGEPSRLPGDSREIPTLVLPYGDVPVLHASAGIQRVIGLCYIMVWAWHEHLMHSETVRRPPQRRLVLLIDEVEAHLHPRWQRVIVPGLMEAIQELSSALTPQIHLATHSPMVMASAEPLFDEETDKLHHLKLVGKSVRLEELPFIRRGTADRWLMSDVFELAFARSVEAERAIKDAKTLQDLDKDEVDPEAVQAVHDRLVKYLAPDDTFWPRWTFFAEQHGVEQ